MKNLNWLLLMAWRDSRRNRSRLLLFISSVVVGIAALVAINSFGENLKNDIQAQAKTLLGADLTLTDNQPIPDSIVQIFKNQSLAHAQSNSFTSMVAFPRTGNTRLAQITALQGNFPFYGKFDTQPISAATSFQNGSNGALVDKVIMLQFRLAVGDSVKVGEATFAIIGQVNSIPGRSAIASMGAPLVFIPANRLAETGLVQLGSRVDYTHYFKVSSSSIEFDKLLKNTEKTLDLAGVRAETVASRQENIKENFDNMNRFLSLVGFIALLLGCVGVGSAIHIYIKGKIKTVALLRCLGVTANQAFWIYIIQIIAISFIGSLLGTLLGILLQKIIPSIMQEFLPLQNISTNISWSAFAWGISTGLVVSILFALLPLLSIRKISPLRTLRTDLEEDNNTIFFSIDTIIVSSIILLFILFFAYLQLGQWLAAFAFVLATLFGMGVLLAAAKLLMWFTRRFFPVRWSYVARQGIANLFRPNNQTTVLVSTIGLGTAMIATLFFVQDLLLRQIELSGGDKQPNMIIFGITPEQKQGVSRLVKEMNLPLMQEVPIVTLRVESINGTNKADYLQDSTKQERYQRWLYEREFRVTYRDELDVATEKLVKGTWHTDIKNKETGAVYISISDRVAEAMKANIGDKMVFNVQGRLLETIVGSVRKVDFTKMQTNFLIVFPTGVLEKAPQMHVIVSRVDSAEASLRFQQNLVRNFPNASAIDLTQILRTVEDILNKLTFVIRFMAMFSIVTGLLVLISSTFLSKYQRLRESVLLRTLGGSRRQILRINALEYIALGSLSALVGILLSCGATYLLAKLVFKIPFIFNPISPLYLFLSIVTLVTVIGLLNSREVLQSSPLEVLRQES